MTSDSGNGNNFGDQDSGAGNSGFGASYDDGFGTGATEGLLLPPWERRERFGLLNGLYLTIKDVLFAPAQFFHQMPTQVGLLQPLYFAVLLGVVASFFAWMWSLTGSSLQMFMADDLEQVFKGPFYSFVAFLGSPITVAFLVFVKAALIHGVLMLVGGNRLGFEATFRVAAYGEAAGILALVPACGSAVGIIWSLVIAVVGLYSIHETDPWRAVVAVVAPAVLCFSVLTISVVGLILGLS